MFFASSAIPAIFSIQLFYAFSFVILAPHLTYILKHFALSCLVLCITVTPATRLSSTTILTHSLNQSITQLSLLSFFLSLPFFSIIHSLTSQPISLPLCMESQLSHNQEHAPRYSFSFLFSFLLIQAISLAHNDTRYISFSFCSFPPLVSIGIFL